MPVYLNARNVTFNYVKGSQVIFHSTQVNHGPGVYGYTPFFPHGQFQEFDDQPDDLENQYSRKSNHTSTKTYHSTYIHRHPARSTSTGRTTVRVVETDSETDSEISDEAAEEILRESEEAMMAGLESMFAALWDLPRIFGMAFRAPHRARRH